jgi:hypothetical protein
MSRVVVAVPWRPQASRLDAFDQLVTWYQHHLPDVELRTIDTDDAIFNVARCRNQAVGAEGDDDVVVLNDADTLPEREPLLRAIEGAAATSTVHLPYTEYRWFGAVGSAQYAAGVPADECDFDLVRGACSGVTVTTPRTWFAHGGQDERFRGWGFEDAAWYLAHETMLGRPPERIQGRVYALHHVPAERRGAQYDANARLMARYEAAAGDRSAMARLIAEAPTARNALAGPGS